MQETHRDRADRLAEELDYCGSSLYQVKSERFAAREEARKLRGELLVGKTGYTNLRIFARENIARVEQENADLRGQLKLQIALEAEVERLEADQEELANRRWFMDAEGYRRCDIPACNCPSWHGGNAYERLCEINDALGSERTNGTTILGAVKALLREDGGDHKHERGSQ